MNHEDISERKTTIYWRSLRGEPARVCSRSETEFSASTIPTPSPSLTSRLSICSSELAGKEFLKYFYKNLKCWTFQKQRNHCETGGGEAGQMCRGKTQGYSDISNIILLLECKLLLINTQVTGLTNQSIFSHLTSRRIFQEFYHFMFNILLNYKQTN